MFIAEKVGKEWTMDQAPQYAIDHVANSKKNIFEFEFLNSLSEKISSFFDRNTKSSIRTLFAGSSSTSPTSRSPASPPPARKAGPQEAGSWSSIQTTMATTLRQARGFGTEKTAVPAKGEMSMMSTCLSRVRGRTVKTFNNPEKRRKLIF